MADEARATRAAGIAARPHLHEVDAPRVAAVLDERHDILGELVPEPAGGGREPEASARSAGGARARDPLAGVQVSEAVIRLGQLRELRALLLQEIDDSLLVSHVSRRDGRLDDTGLVACLVFHYAAATLLS